ncbi:MAG TPA: aldehyde dehydrogenase family protein [Phycisphaerales bacterium]|nr:aldehyde dehydrogenase family protein [Phycisphaerales bacterium]HMP37905.1 aldehyde dehydrogenase family protein [Phycisphaerales bacterium]
MDSRTATPDSALAHPPSDFIDGRFVQLRGGSAAIVARDPADPQRVTWTGEPVLSHVDDAVASARSALRSWSGRPLEARVAILRRWQEVTAAHAERIAAQVCDEMGKTIAECRFEARALAEKVDITLDRISFSRVSDYELAVGATRSGACRFRPHGVLAVLGPFNFPAHLPNGHFVPALILGNTVVLKPSEKTPGTGQLLAELMHEAGIPAGVFNVVQGGAESAARLVAHDDIDGILFTGSWPVGRRILAANLDRPGRIVALEMGGNNPAVVMPTANLRQAAIECVRSAFATTGQRCTCTRRLIVHRAVADRFVPLVLKAASTLLVGPGRSGTPIFMGPVATAAAAEATLRFQSDLAAAGGRVLLESTRVRPPEAPEGHFVTAGIVEVPGFSRDRDEELFGPILQVAVVDSIDEAIAQAGATRFGLAASLFSADDGEWEAFFAGVRAGCVNRNTGTAGASSKLPFGGLGLSGNHRPAAAFSVDYCAHPVASMVERGAEAAVPAGMQWDDRWLGSA